MNYSKRQINNFNAYEKVRKKGLYNMFSREAQASSGLCAEDYMFVLKNYSELREASEVANSEAMLLNQTDHS